MFVTPKNRLMSITNALATQKYTAYSTTIDLDKAKVEEDGTILAGSAYPFSNKVEFPVKNYVLDSQYKNSEFIHLTYNRDSSFRNKYYTHFSVIHQNNANLTSNITQEDDKLKVELISTSNRNYQLMILSDLTQVVRLDRPLTRKMKYKTYQKVNKITTAFSSINGRHAEGGSFTNTSKGKIYEQVEAGDYLDVYKHETIENSPIYNIMIMLEGSLIAGVPHRFEMSEMMIHEGTENTPYYPAVEDFNNVEGEPAQGLMFNDINVEKELEEGIKVVTGKLITGGYVLEDRLPYPIDDSNKENLKMIRFR